MAKKQQEIPGTERETIADLDEALGEYVSIERSAKRAKDKLTEQRGYVEELLAQHNRKKYVYYDGNIKRTASIEPGKSKLKIVDEDIE